MNGRTRFTPLIAALFLSPPTLAGEIIGNTFLGAKNGTIEIVSPEGKWEIKDMEDKGPNAVADLKLKDPIKGTSPTCSVTSATKIAAMIEPDAMAGIMRKALQDQGMELGPLESRRYGGKPVLVHPVSMTKSGNVAKGLFFLLRGPTDYFAVSCIANSVAYDEAVSAFEDLIGKMKY